ncbi:unnamed protein product [Cylindrotheca closterium]|uniref:Uncharacterized protein n=1 Tax=Cylindrotheca closterium TaxID=2856 RepID=A0AAD2FPT4_9STRA|nr:unnamed protein product [Cylindrotheca closterium]
MSRPAKYRQIQTRSAESDGDNEEQDFNSDHDATLSDGGPNRNPRGPTPDTEPEDTAPEDTEAEAEESAEEEEREVPLSAWVHLTHEHCWAVCKGPTSNSKKDRIICGKLKTKCRLHRVLREEGHRAKPMWHEGIVSTKDKNTNTGDYIIHGQQDGFSRSEERMDESLNRATGLDNEESPSEDEEGPEDTDREETDFEATDFEASEGEIEGHLNEDPKADALQELNDKIALMERETQLLRLKAERAKLEAESPKKKPARKGKQATPSKKKAQATARKQTPIARKKKLRKNKPPPKQVSIKEGNNTSKSPSKPTAATARKLDPELSAITTTVPSVLDTVLLKIQPFFIKLQESTEKMDRMMEQQALQENQTPSTTGTPNMIPMGSTNLPTANGHYNAMTIEGNGPAPPTLPTQTPPAVITPTRPTTYQGPIPTYQQDGSKGDSDKIHEIEITSVEIDKAMMPEAMTKNKEINGTYDRADDIAALPGKTSPGGGDSESGSGVSEDVLTRLAETLGSDNSKITMLDSRYGRRNRHGLGLITSEDTLLDAYKQCYKKEDVIFNNCPDRQDHVHSANLLDIRTNCNSKKMLLLQNYAYLCDAKKKGFVNDTITEKNFERQDRRNQRLRDELEAVKAIKGGPKEGRGNPHKDQDSSPKKCSHCKNRDLHIAAGLEHIKTVCPLKDKAGSWAKAAAGKVAAKYANNNKGEKTRPMEEVIKEVSESWAKS